MRRLLLHLAMSACLMLSVPAVGAQPGATAPAAATREATTQAADEATLISSEGQDSAASQPTAGGLKDSMHSLWLESIQNIDPDAGAAELAKAIRQVNAMEVRPKKAPRPASQPATTSAPAWAASEPASVLRDISPQILEKLKTLAPADVDDPARLADGLYTAAQPAAAAIFYEMASKKESPADGAWLAFQLGNCRQKADPAGAIESYRRVSAQWPNSPWAPVATAKAKLLEWMQQNDPQGVLTPSTSPSTQPAK